MRALGVNPTQAELIKMIQEVREPFKEYSFVIFMISMHRTHCTLYSMLCFRWIYLFNFEVRR